MRILPVEDEIDLAEPVRRGLTNEGFLVDVANDGVTGAWLALENPYDVAVLDITLPGKHGYQILKETREAKIWTPVLILAVKDGEYVQTDAFDLGADDYLTKPFSFMVLVAHLRALIHRGAPERPVNLAVGSLVPDPVRRRVARQDTPVAWTPKEYAILQYLMRSHDQVVSKAEILDNVWDSAYLGSDNVIEVYMGYLRRKIDTPFGTNTLKTVRGMGYRLLVLLRASLLENARELAVRHRESVVAQIGEDDSIDITGTDTQITQILNPDGALEVASDDAFTELLYEDGPLAAGQTYLSAHPGRLSITDFDDYLVAAAAVGLPERDVAVVVAVPTSIQRDAVATVGWFLLGGVPVLLAVTMNEMLSRLESADQAQRRIVTNAIHELRCPLASLTTGLEIAAADSTGDTWRETTGILHTQIRRMSYLVEDLLTLAKLDDSGLRFTMSDVDLDDVLNEEITRLKSISDHRINTRLVPVRVTGDANRAAQVLLNVLNNADRHVDTRIDINLTTDGDTIAEDQREKVFDRFVRLDASCTRESGGSGLGLAFSREILRAHDGTITATQTPEGHTRFRITVPRQPTTHATIQDTPQGTPLGQAVVNPSASSAQDGAR